MKSPNGAPPTTSAMNTPLYAHSQPTEFLPDPQPDSWHAWLYLFARGQLMSLSLNRWLYLVVAAVAFMWAVAPLPGGGLVGLAWLLIPAGAWAAIRLARRRSFVAFEPVTDVLPEGRIMPSAVKVPVYVTGTLSVAQKTQRFTSLPGFYRTFATREHALLCRVYERRVLWLGSWPGDEIGLWYAFFTPDQITAIAQGRLRVGGDILFALAVTYWPAAHSSSKHHRRLEPAVVYLAFPDRNDCAAVLADLAVEWRPAP